MTTMPWNPFAVCGIPYGGPVSCCGVTKKGEPCKNSVKVQDTKIGHQKLTTLSREPFDLSTLQSKLCDIARVFLCARWHRQRQADQVDQRWYEAAIRNQARVPHGSRVAALSIAHPGQRQMPPTGAAQPAILTSVANVWAGVQDLTLKDLTLSDQVDDIHCVYCLAEDEDLK
ncbi:hypothetical protein N7475_003540 [Penicillium sp. IBT 31633x]|nr:hypothetical protein N7475_003540 [Penicillium sp. IBT 31633x]